MNRIGFALLMVPVVLSATEQVAVNQVAVNQVPVSQVTVIRAARLFDGKAGHVTAPGLVVVSGGKITAVGKDAAIPAGAVTIDLGDATLLPGFMDAHTHLSMPFERDYRVAEQALLKKTVAERT